MSGVRYDPHHESPRWEPQPLYLPVDEARYDHPENRRGPGDPDESDDRDIPGSHVIVIDLY